MRSLWSCVMIIVTSSFEKTSVFNMFSVHAKIKKASVFKLLGFEKRFLKAPSSQPKGRNIASFLNPCGVGKLTVDWESGQKRPISFSCWNRLRSARKQNQNALMKMRFILHTCASTCKKRFLNLSDKESVSSDALHWGAEKISKCNNSANFFPDRWLNTHMNMSS